MTTYKFIFRVCILQYAATLTQSEVFFYEEELIIHSQKNLNNFYLNLESINDLCKHIDKSVTYFKKRVEKNNLQKTIESSFSLWLQSEAELCSKEIKQKRLKALNISLNALPREIHMHNAGTKRVKRGFKPLGSLISFLTDIPSPQSWESFENLVAHLKQGVIGNANLTHSITATIADISNITEQLRKDYALLTKKSWDLEKELDAFKFYLQASHKIKLLCKNTHILVDDLITEAETMEDIRVKARLNLPSEHMFPPQMILEKLRILDKESKSASPLFKNKEEIEHLYAMSLSAITIEQGIIHGVISIPLIQFNKRFTFIEPNLNEKELEVIEQMSKLSRHPVDYVLCANAEEIKVLSSSKLLKCIKTHNGKTFFCHERSSSSSRSVLLNINQNKLSQFVNCY